MPDNKATLTISFDEGADSSLLAVAMLDDEKNVDANGETKTSFGLTDQPWFLVHLDPKLAISRVRCSSGSVTSRGEVTRTEETDIDVADSEETTELSYNPSGSVGGTWYGNKPGMSVSGRTITWAEPLPAAGKLKYQYRAYSYQYNPPAMGSATEWRTHIVIHVAPRT